MTSPRSTSKRPTIAAWRRARASVPEFPDRRRRPTNRRPPPKPPRANCRCTSGAPARQSRRIDARHPERSEAEIDRDAAPFLFGVRVGINSSERSDKRCLSMVDMSDDADNGVTHEAIADANNGQILARASSSPIAHSMATSLVCRQDRFSKVAKLSRLTTGGS